MTDQLRGHAAFERYVVPELPVLLRVARSLTRQDSAAEDLVQDTLLRAFRAIDGFDGHYPRAWLLTIMRNTHLNSLRRRRPELLRQADQAIELAAEDDTALFDDVFDAAVQAALDLLDPRFRAVVDLVDVRGLSYAEAAAELGVPVGTIMSRLHRARRRLRDHLERAGVSHRSER